MRSRHLVGLALTVAVLAVPVTAWANHTEQSPSTVPVGFLATHSNLESLPVDAFARVAAHGGTEMFIQHVRLGPSGATPWHTHPGPVLVSVEGGSMVVEDAHGADCLRHRYEDGESFVDEGFGHVHRVVAGPDGVDFYAIYLVPAGTATLAKVQPAPPACQR